MGIYYDTMKYKLGGIEQNPIKEDSSTVKGKRIARLELLESIISQMETISDNLGTNNWCDMISYHLIDYFNLLKDRGKTFKLVDSLTKCDQELPNLSKIYSQLDNIDKNIERLQGELRKTTIPPFKSSVRHDADVIIRDISRKRKDAKDFLERADISISSML